ncbi:MAG: MauE/DoxX family redox-associated membrane protein [Jatrophihabitans sp.]
MAQSSLVKWNTARPWLGTVIRSFLGIIWIWAAWSKLQSPRTFVQAVRAYDATPEWLSEAIGYGLPVLEFCIGVALILGVAVRLASIASAVLFVVFLIGLVQAAARGIKLDCGCFGGGGATSAGTSYTLDILRDLGLVLLAAFLVYWPLTRISVDEFIARNDYVAPPSAKRMRTDQGRRKYTAAVDARRRAARSRALYLGASTATVVVLIGLIGIGVQSGRAKIAGSLAAAHASANNGVVFGNKAAATVNIYEDFQCPNCLQFEKSVGAQVDKAVRANEAQVHFHTVSLPTLDTAAGNYYSSRAANAGLCASDVSVDEFVKFHNILFGTNASGKDVQPAEGQGGLPDSDLIKYGKQAGLKPGQLTTFSACVTQEKHKALVQAMTDKASQDGVNGTPTVKVNGKAINNDLASFEKAVAEAVKKGPKPNPSTTPVTSPAVVPSTSAAITKPSTPVKKTGTTAP